jgi:acylphosphatase
LRARLEMRIRGRVQGVGFRWYTVREARGLGLVGYVRNLADGSVRIVAEGEREALEAFLNWAGQGPSHAYVTETEATWSEAQGIFDDFLITG